MRVETGLPGAKYDVNQRTMSEDETGKKPVIVSGRISRYKYNLIIIINSFTISLLTQY